MIVQMGRVVTVRFGRRTVGILAGVQKDGSMVLALNDRRPESRIGPVEMRFPNLEALDAVRTTLDELRDEMVKAPLIRVAQRIPR